MALNGPTNFTRMCCQCGLCTCVGQQNPSSVTPDGLTLAQNADTTAFETLQWAHRNVPYQLLTLLP
jgi:hypothetical protein